MTGVRLAARNLTRGTELAGDVEVASGLWGKFMGLMGRASLADGAALWLPDSNGIHMMFMRFPIDAVFLGRPEAGGDAAGEVAGEAAGEAAGSRPVVAVRERLGAWTGLVPFVRGAHGVLELPAGAVARTGTVVGDRVRLE